MADPAAVARHLLGDGRGVLRLDAGDRELARQLRRAGLPGGAALRDGYRRLLIETPGLAGWVGGVLLPTALPRDPEPPCYVRAVRAAGLVPGARADAGAAIADGLPGALRTVLPAGLERHLERLAGLGMDFLAWRSAAVIRAGRPSAPGDLREAADAAASFAARCLHAGPLPLVQFEVLSDGDHGLPAAAGAAAAALGTLTAALAARHVPVHRVVVATALVTEGVGHPRESPPEQVAAATRSALSALPQGLAGVVVLPGAQRPERLAANLAALRAAAPPVPVAPLCGRALTAAVLPAWRGRPDAVDDARARFVRRLAQLVPAGRTGPPGDGRSACCA